MNTISIPLIPTLDVVDLTSAGFVMETKSKRVSIDKVNWEAYPYTPIVAVDIARSSTRIFVRFFVKGNSLKAVYKDDGSPVYQDSCVEFFLKREDDDYYYNFEFNCIGTCDAAKRLSRDEKRSFSPEQYQMIERYSTIERKTFMEKEGNFSWELIVSFPFSLIGLDANCLPEKIYGNFYKCADETKYPHYLSWQPINTPTPDFHRPEFFGEIYF